MHNLHGGAIQKNPAKSRISAILDMLDNSTAKLKILFDKSKFGFILELTVDEEDSEYTTMDGEPIITFILKLVIISPNQEEGYNYENKKTRTDMRKITETEQTFTTESTTQHNIWFESMVQSRHELCPDVIDAVLLNNELSQRLITFLQVNESHKKDEVEYDLEDDVEDEKVSSMLGYFDDFFKLESKIFHGIGLMVMPKVMNSVTFNSYLDNFPRNVTVYSNIISQIVRLFITLGIIHLDLHHNNILINTDTLYCEIIDFGQTLKLEPSVYQDYYLRYTQLQSSTNSEEQINFMRHAFARIISIEKKKNTEKEPHLQWLSESKGNDIYLLSFQTLVYLMNPPPLPSTNHITKTDVSRKSLLTLKSSVKINISDKKAAAYNAKLQKRRDAKKEEEKKYRKTQRELNLAEQRKKEESLKIIHDCENPGMCTISGGKRKTKKRKLVKKKKKTYKKHTRKQKQK